MSTMREGPSVHASSRAPYGGRGFFQLTGADEGRRPGNYAFYRDYLRTQDDVPYADVVARPMLVESYTYACHSGAWYWWHNELSQWADAGMTREAAKNVSFAIACGPASVARGYCTYRARLNRSDCTWRNVPGLGMRSVCTNPNGWAHRWECTQLAIAAVDAGLVTFEETVPVSDVDKGIRRAKGLIGGSVKNGTVAKPSDAVGLLGADGEIAPSGLLALAGLAGLALVGGNLNG
jgi:hypothetical protein